MEIHGTAVRDGGIGEEIMGEEIMGLDGRLKEGHPLVEKHQMRLPKFHPVVVFEVPARRRL